MKRVLFVLLLAGLFTNVAAQSQCGTPTNFPNTLPGYNYEPGGLYDEAPICVNVFFHIVRNSNGTGGFNPGNIPNLMARLNEAFNPHNILVTNAGQDFIDNDTYAVEFNDGEFNALTSTQSVTNAINFYLLPINPTGYAGRASAIPGRSLVVGATFILTSTSPHELGHCLNLFHTHHQLEQGGCNDNGSNCAVCGDFVCDTPVDPLLACGSNVDPFTCAYTGGGGFNPDTRNIMSYSCRNECRNRFSPGQGLRMRTSLFFDPLLSQFVTTSCVNIQGSASICNNTAQTYIIQNPPPNATFNWTIANTTIAQIQGSNTGQSVIVTSVGNGRTTLRCDITLPTGVIFAIKDINSGSPFISDGAFIYNGQPHPLAYDWGGGGTASNPICKGLQGTVSTTWPTANSVTWSGPGYSFPATWYNAGFNSAVSNMNFSIYNAPVTGFWSVTGTNGCGSVTYPIAINSINCADPCTYYRVSPNPTVKGGEIIIIAKPAPIPCDDPLPYKTGITAINIYDEKGIIISKTKGNQATKMNTRLSPNRKGLLIVEIVSGTHTEQHKIIVQ